MTTHRNSLKPDYKLHWYLIKKILGQGGFGITYLAEDLNLNQLVAIKEFLPVELAMREGDASIQPVSVEHGEQYSWGLERFMSEAQTLAKFKHPNIVRVLAVFPENNTAYMVMEFEHGRGLHELLKDKKTLDEQTLNEILSPIMDGLAAVHAAGFIHRDIKPPNIYIRENGSPVLLDFGSARQSLSEHTKTLTTMVSPGYAPFEQYVGRSDKQGPWTDIYGIGATMYRAVTGIAPAGSMDRSEAILHTEKDIYVSAMEISKGKYSDQFLQAIDHALAFKPEDRPQTIADWRQEFADPFTPPKDVNEKLTSNDTFDTTESNKETVRLEPVRDSVEKSQTVTIPKLPTVTFTERLYRIVKKLLKWGAILLMVLIMIGILTNSKNRREKLEAEQELTQQPSVQEEFPAEQPEITEPEPITEQVDEGQQDVQADQSALTSKIDELLAGAEKNLNELRLTTPAGNNALEKFREVQALDPGNTDALNGIDRIVDEYIQLMDRAIDNKNLPSAHNYFNKGYRVNPEHSGLVSARQRLDAATEKNRLQQSQPVKESTSPEQKIPEPKIEEDASLVPESEREEIRKAHESILQEPKNTKARRELRKVAKQVESKIKEAIKQKDFDLAEDYINEILQYAGENSKKKKELLDLLQKIRTKKLESGN